MKSLTQQSLALRQDHNQEWQVFFMTQTALRISLNRQHREELSYLKTIQATPRQYAVLMRKQSSEIMEFTKVHRDGKWRIRQRQNQETSDLGQHF